MMRTLKALAAVEGALLLELGNHSPLSLLRPSFQEPAALACQSADNHHKETLPVNFQEACNPLAAVREMGRLLRFAEHCRAAGAAVGKVEGGHASRRLTNERVQERENELELNTKRLRADRFRRVPNPHRILPQCKPLICRGKLTRQPPAAIGSHPGPRVRIRLRFSRVQETDTRCDDSGLCLGTGGWRRRGGGSSGWQNRWSRV